MSPIGVKDTSLTFGLRSPAPQSMGDGSIHTNLRMGHPDHVPSILRVLVVEADRATASDLVSALTAGGMEAVAVDTAAASHLAFDIAQPSIVLIGLPLSDSLEFDLVRHYAATNACGVIVAATDWAEAAGIAGLEAGADDFIAKPVLLDNLVARIRAVSRRLNRSLSPTAPMTRDKTAAELENQPVITVDATRRCLVGPTGERTLLTEAELSALETLLDAKGASVSREWLGRVALRRLIRVDDRSVDQLVMKLRRKLSAQGVSERAILSARRQGYVIPEPELFRASVTGVLATLPDMAQQRLMMSASTKTTDEATLQPA